MSTYIPHTDEDIRQMLGTIGKPDLEALFSALPENVLLQNPLCLPPGKTELELSRSIRRLADRNRILSDLGDPDCGDLTGFLGAGAYDHTVPAAVDELTLRQEFYTAYTPYQPEISQGTLQALFEYQTMVCALTELEVSNASLYDGATACIEACRMAVAHTRRKKLVVSEGIHPHVLASMETLLAASGTTLIRIPLRGGRTDPEALARALRADIAGVVVQSPNFLGIIEDLTDLADPVHQVGALLIQECMDALALCVLTSPGEAGVDIAAGSGQVFGGYLSFGGPHLGFLATTTRLMRRLPGRIVGQTTDIDGRRAYVLTLQTREQHIRRDKATSNVCSNHSLSAVRATIYLSLLGPEGLREVAVESMLKSRNLNEKLLETGAFERVTERPFFREFPLRYLGSGQKLETALLRAGFLGGFALGTAGMIDMELSYDNTFVFCATEKTTAEDIDRLGRTVAAIFRNGGEK